MLIKDWLRRLNPLHLAEGSVDVERLMSTVYLCGEPPARGPEDPEVADSWTPRLQPARPIGKLANLSVLKQSVTLAAKAIRMSEKRRLEEVISMLIPIPLEARMTGAVRPVIWWDENWPGSLGTCFLVRGFGCTFAVTARHVLGGVQPANMMIPRNIEDPHMDLVQPEHVFWYNAGAYDHLADIGIAVLGEDGDTPLSVLTVGFTAPRVGEHVLVPGFPAAESEVHHNLSTEPAPILTRDGTPLRHLFVWNPVMLTGRCLEEPSATALGRVEWGTAQRLPEKNGMSGSPVFVQRGGKLAIAGMLVRAGERYGHLIGGDSIAFTTMRVAAKRPEAVASVYAIVDACSIAGRPVRDTPGDKITKLVSDYLSGILEGDRQRLNAVLRDWMRGKGSLAQLVHEQINVGRLREALGDDIAEMVIESRPDRALRGGKAVKP